MPEIVFAGDNFEEFTKPKFFAAAIYTQKAGFLYITIHLSALAAELIQLQIGDKLSLYLLPESSKIKIHKSLNGTSLYTNRAVKSDDTGLIMKGCSLFILPLAHVFRWLPHFPVRTIVEKFSFAETRWAEDWVEFPSSLFLGFD